MATTKVLKTTLRLNVDEQKQLEIVMKLLNENTGNGAIAKALFQLPNYIKLYKQTQLALEKEIAKNNLIESRVKSFTCALNDLMIVDKRKNQTKIG